MTIPIFPPVHNPRHPGAGDDTGETSAGRRTAWWRARAARYAISAAAWLIALGLTIALAPHIQRANFVFFWVAVLFAASYAGLGAALVAAASAILAVQYFVVPPFGSFKIADDNLYVFAIFAGASAMVSVLTARLQEASRMATARSEELQLLNDQLRHQQQILEEQTGELESQTEEAEALTEELAETNVRLEHVAQQAEEARDFSDGILSSILDAFIALDHELRFLYVNGRAEAMFGRARTELVGRRMWDVFPEAEHSHFGAAFTRVLQTGAPETVEGFSRMVGCWIETRLYPSPRGLSVFFQDVSARRRAQETSEFLVEASRLLNASLDYETTLQALAEAAVPRLGDWCVVDVVRDPSAESWPPVLDRLAVVHRDPRMVALVMELRAKYPTDWTSDSGMAGVYRTRTPFFVPAITDAVIAAVAQSEEHARLLRELRLASAIVVPLEARGRMLGSLTLAMSDSGRRFDERDLELATELALRAATAVDNARLYREAERARAEAEESNRAKGLFLTTMSHELRTPLNAITGYVDLLDMELRGPVTEAQRTDLRRVRRSAKTLMALVNDVLNFARIEAGQVDFRIVELPLDALLADLDMLVRPQVEAKHLHYDHARCSEPLRVRADPDRVKQILTNLLTNAIKFTDAGGRITLACEASEDGRSVRIMVQDTGRGIPAEQLERIFEPFVQVDRHLNPGSQQGVGLGLAISRDLALGMQGELTAESTAGEGSTFTLTLPRA